MADRPGAHAGGEAPAVWLFDLYEQTVDESSPRDGTERHRLLRVLPEVLSDGCHGGSDGRWIRRCHGSHPRSMFRNAAAEIHGGVCLG
jgi:hypothetical protein